MMREIKNHEGYFINESGIVINKNGHVMRTAVSNSGYLRTTFDDPTPDNPKHRKNESIHRLVAETFLENPDPEKNDVVMHLDNDKLNNHVSNLKWGTQAENITQSVKDGLRPSHKGQKSSYLNVYEVFDPKGDTVVRCNGRTAVAETIQYEEISLKNMIGNGREIAIGPYAGYQIRRTGEKVSVYDLDNGDNKRNLKKVKPFKFVDYTDIKVLGSELKDYPPNLRYKYYFKDHHDF